MLRSLLLASVALALGAGPALAALQIYPVGPIQNLPDIDDGVGPLRFDFSKVKLTDKYDGFTCFVTLYGDATNQPTPLARAKVSFVEKGHLKFSEAHWATFGMSKPEDMYRANLAVTSKSQIVGAMLVYNIIDKPGGMAHPAQTVVIKASDGTLNADMPVGNIHIDSPDDTPGLLNIIGCKK